MIDYEAVETFLAHVGVKGMKWGVRRDKTITANARRTRDRLSKARKATSEADRKRLKDEAYAHEDYTNSVYLTTGSAALVAILSGGVGNVAMPAIRKAARAKQNKARQRLAKNEY